MRPSFFAMICKKMFLEGFYRMYDTVCRINLKLRGLEWEKQKE